MESIDKIQWVLDADNTEELAKRYDSWAEAYDQDLDEVYGYRAPQVAAETVTRYVVDKGAQILDAGAGTGLVGQLLHQQGYTNLVALDISAGMLAVARKKGCYAALDQKVLGEALDYPNASFDAVISCGAMTYGHVPASAFDELVRITKPDGYIIFGGRAELLQEEDMNTQITKLESAGMWQLVNVEDPFLALPKYVPDGQYRFWVYQIVEHAR